LLGLVAFTTLQRTKEIGVRKVLGATVQNILTLLALDFIRLMFIAILLAVPFIAWALDRWLNRYAFRIELHWWLFAIPVSLIVVVALLTVVLESLKVALTNPAKSLRDE
jgi:putative ABC transport system permease protein